jgi:hypothetical protein
MVYVTPTIRWGIGIWCTIAIVLLISSAVRGASPVTLVLTLVLSAMPVIVLAALTRFRAEPRTAAQVLHDRAPDAPR